MRTTPSLSYHPWTLTPSLWRAIVAAISIDYGIGQAAIVAASAVHTGDVFTVAVDTPGYDLVSTLIQRLYVVPSGYRAAC